MNPDFLDIIRALLDAEARFIIVGAYALNVYIDPRATGDLDIWVEATRENAAKVIQALKQFGAPLSDVIESDFARTGVTLQIGIAPRRIDLLTELSGIEFDEAWKDRSMFPFGPLTTKRHKRLKREIKKTYLWTLCLFVADLSCPILTPCFSYYSPSYCNHRNPSR
jgi:hypothetical protein